MSRRRKAWAVNGNGRRMHRGRTLPGFYVRWTERGPSGRTVHRSRSFQSYAAMSAWLRRRNGADDRRAAGELVEIPLFEAAVEFLEHCVSLARSTQQHYMSALAQLVVVVGRDRLLSEITAADIERFIQHRLVQVVRATVARDLRALRRFFRWASHVDRRYIDADPCGSASGRPKDNIRRERPVISDAQLAQVVEALGTEDRRLAAWIAMTTGLDRGTIVALTPRNIDLDGRAIRYVRRKTGKMNVAPIHPALLRPLAERCRRNRPGERLLHGLARQARPYDWWRRAVEAAGCPELLFRDLRAIATARLRRIPGIDLGHAQQLLGHASIQTTARHYMPADPAVVQAFEGMSVPGFPVAVESQGRAAEKPAEQRGAKAEGQRSRA